MIFGDCYVSRQAQPNPTRRQARLGTYLRAEACCHRPAQSARLSGDLGTWVSTHPTYVEGWLASAKPRT